jgi:predicted HTH domain antitoxin
MTTLSVELDPELVTLLEGLDRPIQESARELIVLELYRRGAISSGKAAQLLGVPRHSFLDLASRLGVPYFGLTGAELEQERRDSESL